MLRNRSARFIATSLFSSLAMLTLLTGCGNSKKSKAPGVTGSISGLSAARLGKNRTNSQLPIKASPLANSATKLSKAFKKNPANSELALNYIYHLRSLGMQRQAVGALHRAYQANPQNPTIASEYGRLLLGSGKSMQAQRVLGRIDAKANPDWHNLSALGTIEARNGSYEKATEYFRQANELAPKQASVINNLALSLALGGKPDEAENLLRNADDSGRFGARLRQNLALVLALQGKYDEAQAMATTDLTPKQASINIAYLKKMLATTDSQTGIQLTDETIAPSANIASREIMRNEFSGEDDTPAATASITQQTGQPTDLTPPQQ